MRFYDFCDSLDIEPDLFAVEIFLQSGEAEQDWVHELVASGYTEEQAREEWQARGREVITETLKEVVAKWGPELRALNTINELLDKERAKSLAAEATTSHLTNQYER
jgi:hypothetical protein